jgi:pilus assembly protein CpaD
MHQPTHRMRRSALRVVLLAAASLLAGCQLSPFSRFDEQVQALPTPSDYRERHPIAIREGERTLEVLIGVHRGGLTHPQRGDVAAFARSWRREATGGIVIDVPVGTQNARAAADAMREIKGVLAASAVHPHAVTMRSYAPVSPHALATIKLHYPKMIAEAGPCGQWPEDIGPVAERHYNENQPYFNLGCAQQRNLAAMVANPADLVQPRDEADVYAPRRQMVLDKYRKGEGPATVYPKEGQGRVSNVGQ